MMLNKKLPEKPTDFLELLGLTVKVHVGTIVAAITVLSETLRSHKLLRHIEIGQRYQKHRSRKTSEPSCHYWDDQKQTKHKMTNLFWEINDKNKLELRTSLKFKQSMSSDSLTHFTTEATQHASGWLCEACGAPPLPQSHYRMYKTSWTIMKNAFRAARPTRPIGYSRRVGQDWTYPVFEPGGLTALRQPRYSAEAVWVDSLN